MSPEVQAEAEALRRIEQARREHPHRLDLGGLALLTVPKEIACLTTLRDLALGRNALHTGFTFDGERTYSPLRDLSALAGLPHLERLDLTGCFHLKDLQPLAGLVNLTYLGLRYSGVSDLSPLAGLKRLQHLNVVECFQLASLAPLAGLLALESLYLNVTQVTNLGPVAALERLHTLHLAYTAIADLRPIADLHSLRHLNIRSTAVADLTALSGLRSLEDLKADWCAQLQDLRPLSGLTALRHLNLEGCQGLRSFAPLLPLLPTLQTLILDLCPFVDLPPELCGSDHENVLDRVRAHFADLETGAENDAEVRLLVLGNGGVGKTQLCRRLQQLPFDPSRPSTHGIQLGHFSLTLQECGKPVHVWYWDFGGQDIYHGTHALFIHRQALVLVLWHPEHESGETVEAGVRMRNRPLAYWLDYLRSLASPETSVLVLQSRCDEPRQRVRAPAVPTEDFRYLRFLEFSARTNLGSDALLGQVKECIRNLLAERPLQSIGRGRLAVRDRLRQMQQQGEVRLLTGAEFLALCQEAGGISSPEALLDFLHHAGVVFHRPGLFEDRIILDQAWALDAIYTLFHRQDTLPYLIRDGRFTRELLGQLAWKDRSPAEQQVLLGMMESCGLCFKIRNLAPHAAEPVWEYLAPDLLPEWSHAKAQLLGRLRTGEPDDSARVRYAFLHEGILRTFLARIGQQAGDAAVYWKYGCWFVEVTTGATVLVNSDVESGTVHLGVWGRQATALLDRVLKTLLAIRVGQSPEVVRGTTPVSAPERERLAKSSDGEGIAGLRPVRRDQVPDTVRKAVYLSYAWGDGSAQGREREALVDRLCGRLADWGYAVIRDRDALQPGDCISVFMRSLGQADRVVVVLSEKYLRSVYCMTELHEIFRNSRLEKAEFLRRIVPLTLDDARIGSIADRARHALYWKKQREELQPLVAEGVLGETDLAQWCRIARWVTDVGDILAHINDTLHAVGFDAIVGDDFAGVRTRLERSGEAP